MAAGGSTSKGRTLGSQAEELRRAGFEIQQQASGRILVRKFGCAAVLEQSASGDLEFSVRPGFLIGGDIAHLVDGGFQKFWQDGKRKVPALAEQLKSLHSFQQDLRAALGITTLYNEALGTVSSRYVYDRVEGREQAKRHEPFD
jgi:hypothetical protein